MAYLQEQSIFFRLPLEIREEVYQYCRGFYAEMFKDSFRKDRDGDYTTLFRDDVGGRPALLQSCRRIKDEAEPWIYRRIDIKFTEDIDVRWLTIGPVGKFDMGHVRTITLDFEDVMSRPTELLDLMEYFIDHAPRLQRLEVEWEEMVHCPMPVIGTIFEDTVEPWFPIFAKAKSLKTLKLDGLTRQWAAVLEEVLRRHNQEVKLELTVYEKEDSIWADWWDDSDDSELEDLMNTFSHGISLQG
ncbi:hypothetical protein F5Y13DRAFT_156321 [Hypoxylon sp. FL1857]|nr:hypothetical protein F5Y13DRAFT_156321 [Hypoxylon sp. FL1857]